MTRSLAGWGSLKHKRRPSGPSVPVSRPKAAPHCPKLYSHHISDKMTKSWCPLRARLRIDCRHIGNWPQSERGLGPPGCSRPLVQPRGDGRLVPVAPGALSAVPDTGRILVSRAWAYHKVALSSIPWLVGLVATCPDTTKISCRRSSRGQPHVLHLAS